MNYKQIFLAAALISCGISVGLATEPSQKPLVIRAGQVPIPNVMFTMDDSGSMLADFLPEGNFTVNGYTVNLGGEGGLYRSGFLDDSTKKLLTPYAFYNANYHLTVTAVKNAAVADDPVYQMQFRSPDVNALFYNPEIQYLPWIYAAYTAAKPRWNLVLPVSITAARLEPQLTTTKNLAVTTTNLSAKWCTGPSSKCTADESTEPVTESKNFYPGLYYRLKSGANPNLASSYDRFDVNSSSEYGTANRIPAGRADCVTYKNSTSPRCSQAEEQQNFANWFTYYRMRQLTAKAAISEVLFAFVDKIRAGWGQTGTSKTATPSQTNIDGKNFYVIKRGIRDLNLTQMKALLLGIQYVAPFGYTPNRSAVEEVGKYFSNRGEDAGNPWLTTVGTAGSGKLKCRRSINVLVTDGYYNNERADWVNPGDWDTELRNYKYEGVENPNSKSPNQYIPGAPFWDGDGSTKIENTLADVASKYFIQDLDPSIPNGIEPVDGDIAFWQHLTQYMVGLGVSGTLDASTPAAKVATLKQIKEGTLTWPKPNPSSNPATLIDDMWHAAVNSGGDYYSVKNSTELTNALKKALGTATGVVAKESGVATTVSTLTAGNTIFVPRYRSVSWWGDVSAYDLNEFAEISSSKGVKWQASDVLPKDSQRSLFTMGATAPVEFTWSALSGESALLAATGLTENLVNYIRGSAALEGITYRARDGKPLGDFINSPPALVKGSINLNYQNLSNSSEAGTYKAYWAAKSSRSKGVLFVGGNSGALNGFRDTDGVEVFGYLPREGLVNLNQIASVDYGTGSGAAYHRYFVDGSTKETDAFIQPRGEAASRWTNMVIGSMGAGGKSLFALTVPTNDPTQMAANSVQWELRGDADLGHVTGDFGAGKIQGGSKWYGFFGNGIYSPNGNAVLLIVDLETGVISGKITVPTSGANGLMGVRTVKNANEEIYAVYAGDLQGNLWRFDLTGDDPSNWVVSFGNKPLFTAVNGSSVKQAIVAAPVVVGHETSGVVLVFGTGRLLDEADTSDVSVQSLYGIWDKTEIGESAATATSPFDGTWTSSPRDILQVQTLNPTKLSGANVVGDYYSSTSNTVDWSTKSGWYMDLTLAAGQRVIYTARVNAGVAFLTSLVPPVTVAACEQSSGLSFVFALDAVSGGQLDYPVSDTNDDGKVDSSDADSSGFQKDYSGNNIVLSQYSENEDTSKKGGDQYCAQERLSPRFCSGSTVCDDGWCPNYLLDGSIDPDLQCTADSCTGKCKICKTEVKNTIKDRVWKIISNPPK